ncbi:MAG TPA: DMT family transporter [Methylomirabilota bacterium]|nr:DMT family transporter [Methylomirabilota bacterium]
MLLASLLALGSATMYGAADFFGGLATRRTNLVAVVVVSQFSGMVALVIVLPWLPDAAPATRDLVWGALAGIAIGAGLALLYRALAMGRMVVVAPTTAVCAVVIPVIGALLLGERPGPRTLVGIALAIVSIVLVSQQRAGAARGDRPTAGASGLPAGLGVALLAGVAIGLFFLALARTAPAAGLWPLLVARFVSVVLSGTAALAGGQSLRMAVPVVAMVIAGGLMDMLANTLYLLATHHGPLSVVVTLSSLYPASTVILALAVLGERLSALQGVGIACALIAVLLIVGG